MNSLRSLLTGLSLFALLTGCIALQTRPGLGPLQEHVIKKGTSSDKILVISIDGPIMDAEKKDFMGNTLDTSITARVKEELDLARKDPQVRAVLLRIDSPGGSVTPCDVIYNEIVTFKKEKKIPVVVQMGSITASGGVYIAASADRIIASPTTVTGSIGVIAQLMSAKDLLDKIGVKGETIKSGDKKDMGSPFRSLTEEERALFQDVINSMYERFLSVILEGRKNLDEKRLRSFADGRIFTAKKALEYGLIDSIGYTDDAIAQTEKLSYSAGATIVTYSRPGHYVPNIFSSSAPTSTTINLLNLDSSFLEERFGMRFMYMMQP
jgi:protease IV